MPPFDRDAALKAAEKALKLGKVDAAIAEYVKVVEAQPRDWNSANTLGDLYVRSNKVERGLEQYVRIADHLKEEGFFPKAAALYKKILKLKPDDEYALLQAGDLAATQGLLADAKQYFLQVAERRKARGDRKGAAAVAIRLGTLDPEDLDARLRAGQLAAEMGDHAVALREFREVALRLEQQDKHAEALVPLQLAYDLDKSDESIRRRLFSAYLNGGNADLARQVASSADDLKQVAAAYDHAGNIDAALDVLAHIAAADPSDLDVRANLALAFVARGDLDKARAYLSAETAGANPALWLTLAEMELRGDHFPEGKSAVVQALTLDRNQAQPAIAMACRLAEANPEAGFQAVDAVADVAVAESDFAAAAAALGEFTSRVRSHLVALMRLVEICVDGGLDATLDGAQAALAEAYLDAGRGLEARIISEDLMAREPSNRLNVDRFRRALVMLGEDNPDAIIADRLSGESPFLALERMDLNEGMSFDAPAAAVAAGMEAVAHQNSTRASDSEADSIEIDLTEMLDTRATVEPFQPLPLIPPPPRSLDQVFRGMRDDSGRASSEEAAAEQYRLALTYHEMGMVDDAIAALQGAARSPRQRFDAASMLGRLYLERNDAPHAIEWLERAAEAPAPTPDAGRALLYDLAKTLESSGEHSRALAVFVELESESGGYRDVARQIDRLSKVQARG
ncbi:MAG TPA: tetratricopeptide repeat protein [Vicinamibacterales bacterium]|nr:tetratricopeptide repeat protein [Vicinamibacterales bacterium]